MSEKVMEESVDREVGFDTAKTYDVNPPSQIWKIRCPKCDTKYSAETPDAKCPNCKK
jgi:Zn finger protein HypA/HybF involved in hydrogenase expression